MPKQAPERWRPPSPLCSSWSTNRRRTWRRTWRGRHGSRRLFALELGLDGQLLELVVRTARVHDVGKLAIPPWVLEKPGPLTHYERALMEAHSVIGQKILERKPALARLGPLVRATHERWDGNGYPDRLKGSAIPLPSRIVTVCDAFDAMTHPRAYRGSRRPRHGARGAASGFRHAVRPWRHRDVPVRFRRDALTALRYGALAWTQRLVTGIAVLQRRTTTPDGVLVQEAAAGSGVSYGALYDRYAEQVYNYCLRLTGSPEDAGDATQEAFVNVLRRLQEDDRPVLEFSSYLFAAARHESYALMRQRARTHPTDSPPAERGRVADLETDPERSVLLRDSQEAVRDANAQLPPRHREVLALREVAGRSYEEIGATMGISENAAAQLIFRARSKLREAMTAGSGRVCRRDHRRMRDGADAAQPGPGRRARGGGGPRLARGAPRRVRLVQDGEPRCCSRWAPRTASGCPWPCSRPCAPTRSRAPASSWARTGATCRRPAREPPARPPGAPGRRGRCGRRGLRRGDGGGDRRSRDRRSCAVARRRGRRARRSRSQEAGGQCAGARREEHVKA